MVILFYFIIRYNVKRNLTFCSCNHFKINYGRQFVMNAINTSCHITIVIS